MTTQRSESSTPMTRRGQIDTAVEVVAPENVAFRYQLAGPFRRLPAFVFDVFLRFAVLLILLYGLILLSLVFPMQWIFVSGVPLALVVWFGFEWFYGAILESCWNGQTFGKRLTRIRVVSVDGRPIDGMQAVLRNLLRYVDLMPLYPLALEGGNSGIVIPTCAIGLTVALCSRRLQRLGDYAAGTMVVVEQRSPFHEHRREPPASEVLELAQLLPANLHVVRSEADAVQSFHERSAAFPRRYRVELIGSLAKKWIQRFDLPSDTDPETLFLAMYYRLFVADQIPEEERGMVNEQQEHTPSVSRVGAVVDMMHAGESRSTNALD